MYYLAIIGIVALAGIAFLIYWMYSGKKGTTATKEKETKESPETEEVTPPPVEVPVVVPPTDESTPPLGPAPMDESPELPRPPEPSATDEAYGLYPSAPWTCPRQSCAYAAVRMPGDHCRAIGGTMSDPTTTDWTDCMLLWGRKDPSGAVQNKGFNPAGLCPSGNCQYGIIETTGGTCRKLGGAMNGEPTDDEWTNCHMTIDTSPKWGIYAPGVGPSGSSYDMHFVTIGSNCESVGGIHTNQGNDWGDCSMQIGPADQE